MMRCGKAHRRAGLWPASRKARRTGCGAA